MPSRIHPILVLIVAVLGCSGWLWVRSTRHISRAADAYMLSQVRNSRFSGAVLISRDGHVLLSRGYGYANAEWRTPNAPQTKFRIASLTKQFTAVAVMQLRQQGKLRISDSICKYVEACPPAWMPITIRHLLSHTSGIHNYSDDPNFQNLKKLTRNRAEILDGLRNEGLDFTPGEQFRYSNSGYFLLGLIIEKVAGLSYESVLSHQIFAPLSMNATGYNHYETVLLGRASGYRAGPHGALENADYDDTDLPFAAGGLYSTVEDLERWNEALLEGTLLPPAVLAEMWTPVKDAYGYGWFLPAASAGTLHRRAVYHSGSVDGFVSCMTLFPDERVTVVVLANFVMVKHACSLASDLAAIAFGEDSAIQREPQEVGLDSHIVEQYVGDYRTSGKLVIKVTVDHGRLFAQATGLPKLEMHAESERGFFFRELDARAEFVVNAAGGVTSLVVHLPLRDDLSAERVPRGP